MFSLFSPVFIPPARDPSPYCSASLMMHTASKNAHTGGRKSLLSSVAQLEGSSAGQYIMDYVFIRITGSTRLLTWLEKESTAENIPPEERLILPKVDDSPLRVPESIALNFYVFNSRAWSGIHQDSVE